MKPVSLVLITAALAMSGAAKAAGRRRPKSAADVSPSLTASRCTPPRPCPPHGRRGNKASNSTPVASRSVIEIQTNRSASVRDRSRRSTPRQGSRG